MSSRFRLTSPLCHQKVRGTQGDVGHDHAGEVLCLLEANGWRTSEGSRSPPAAFAQRLVTSLASGVWASSAISGSSTGSRPFGVLSIAPVRYPGAEVTPPDTDRLLLGFFRISSLIWHGTHLLQQS